MSTDQRTHFSWQSNLIEQIRDGCEHCGYKVSLRYRKNIAMCCERLQWVTILPSLCWAQSVMLFILHGKLCERPAFAMMHASMSFWSSAIARSSFLILLDLHCKWIIDKYYFCPSIQVKEQVFHFDRSSTLHACCLWNCYMIKPKQVEKLQIHSYTRRQNLIYVQTWRSILQYEFAHSKPYIHSP